MYRHNRNIILFKCTDILYNISCNLKLKSFTNTVFKQGVIMKVFRFKKGMKVPSWVQTVVNSESFNVTFGCKGKLFILDNDDLYLVASKLRKREYLIKVNTVDNKIHDFLMNGAGHNNNKCWLFFGNLAFKNARRKHHIIKNKAMCKLITSNDPRVTI